MNREALARVWGNKICKYLIDDKGVPIASKNWSPQLRAIPSSYLITFSFKLAKPRDLNRVLRMGDELALFLGARNCRLVRHYGNVLAEFPMPARMWHHIDATTLKRAGGMTVSLGMTTLQTPVTCRVNSDSIAPILVTGRAGAGKTETIRLILWQLMTQNAPTLEQDPINAVNLLIFDPKGKFRAIDRSPHLVYPICRTREQGVQALGWLLKQLHERVETGIVHPKVIFAIDELIILMGDDDLIGDGVGRLAALGREYGIHLIMGTQRPDRKHMDRLTAANIGLRLVGKSADTTESRVACGMGGCNAHLLNGCGDFLAVVKGMTHRLQVGLVPEQTIAELPLVDEPPEVPEGVYDLRVMLGLRTVEQREIERAPYSPEEIALALTNVGIGQLKRALGMGQPRATRLRNMWAKPIMDKLDQLGYRIARKEG